MKNGQKCGQKWWLLGMSCGLYNCDTHKKIVCTTGKFHLFLEKVRLTRRSSSDITHSLSQSHHPKNRKKNHSRALNIHILHKQFSSIHNFLCRRFICMYVCVCVVCGKFVFVRPRPLLAYDRSELIQCEEIILVLMRRFTCTPVAHTCKNKDHR